MKKSILVKSQFKTFTKQIKVNGKSGRIVCEIRYDDRCGNGRNSFTITGSIYLHPTSSADRYFASSGCIHSEIQNYFPEFKHLIKWHLMNSDAPMHYIANTIYWARENNLANARSCAIWEDATLEQLQNKELLKARLPKLIEEFIADIETVGFIY